jgi:hypothetical protein
VSRPPFPSLRVAGGLLPADLFVRVLDDKDLAGRDPASYGLASRESVREAASRAFDYLGSAWEAFARERDRAIAEGRPLGGLTRDRWLLIVFRSLDYGILPTTPAGGLVVEDRAFKVSHAYGHVPIHLLGCGVDLDRRTRGVAGAADAAPQSMVQELLNRTETHLWAIVSNGQKLRLLRDSRSLAGSAYVEFDVELIFTEQLFSDFMLLFRLMHASRLTVEPDQPPASCWLERWRTAAIEQGERALAGLRAGVESAITTLGTGFLQHPANCALRDCLADGRLSGDDYKRAVLRMIYRLLFWFVAEDRDVLLDPEARARTRLRYVRFFSSQRLRERARRVGVDHHDDLWDAVRIVFVALGTPQGRPELGLPGIGGLFERETEDEQGDPLPASGPDVLDEPLERLRLANDDLLSAVHDLSVIGSLGLRPVDFRHLGSEELGSVYESLLELHPSYDPLEQRFALIGAAGNERKMTGSYYTPSSLTELLLDNALDPVLAAAARTAGDAEAKVAALLAVTVCDPACGSGHFLVAAARRIARRVAQLRSGEEEPAPDLVRAAMREVVSRCIYGVDVNDMAAELAKVSLWLESVEPGRPLPFLDANIRVGNSLLGTTPVLIAPASRRRRSRHCPATTARSPYSWRSATRASRRASTTCSLAASRCRPTRSRGTPANWSALCRRGSQTYTSSAAASSRSTLSALGSSASPTLGAPRSSRRRRRPANPSRSPRALWSGSPNHRRPTTGKSPPNAWTCSPARTGSSTGTWSSLTSSRRRTTAWTPTRRPAGAVASLASSATRPGRHSR